jgi:hypothetical protein
VQIFICSSFSSSSSLLFFTIIIILVLHHQLKLKDRRITKERKHSNKTLTVCDLLFQYYVKIFINFIHSLCSL